MGRYWSSLIANIHTIVIKCYLVKVCSFSTDRKGEGYDQRIDAMYPPRSS